MRGFERMLGVGLASLFLLGGASAAQTSNFETEIRPFGSISVVTPADLGVDIKGYAIGRLEPFNETALRIELPHAELRFVESRFQTLAFGGRQVTIRDVGTLQPAKWQETARDLTIEVLQARSANQLWSLMKGDSRLGVGAGPDCSFAPMRPGTIEDHLYAAAQYLAGRGPEPSPGRATRALDPELRLEVLCEASQPFLGKVHEAQFGGFLLALRYTDDRGSTVGRLVSTRFDVAPNSTLPNMWDHDLQVLSVRVPSAGSGPRSPFDIDLTSSRTKLRLMTPALLASGQLRIPTSEGTLSWNGRDREGRIGAIEPAGAFHATPLSIDLVRIEGETWNAAPDVAGDGTSFDAARVTLAAAVAGLAWLSWRTRFLVVGLFSRLTKERALDHPRRRAIVEAVTHNPGARTKDLCDLLSLSRRIMDHHVGVLLGQGLIVRRTVGRSTAFFVRPPSQPDFANQLWLNRSQAARLVVEALVARPRATQRQIAATTGLSQPYVSQLLRRLRAAGAVERDGQRKRPAYVATGIRPWESSLFLA